MKFVAIDFETYLISDEQPIPKPVCLSYAESETKTGLLVTYQEMDKYLSELIVNDDKILIAHNIVFESTVILKHFPHLWDNYWIKMDKGLVECTQLYQQLINNISERSIHKLSLAGLVEYYFNKDISETKTDPNAWRLRYSELDGVPLKDWPKDAIDYAIDDSIWALRCFEKQLMREPNLKSKPHILAGVALNWAGLFGMTIDKEKVKILEKELHEKVDPIREKLIHKGYATIDKKTGKTKKKMKLLREYLKEKFTDNIKLTDKGEVATGNEALEYYYSLDENDSIVNALIDLAQYEKILSAFVPRLLDVTTVMRTQYNPIVSSGRTSSRASALFPSVNIQQMPREVKDVTYDVRNCFSAREGYEICSIDYNSLEPHATANQLYDLYGKSEMLNLFNSGDFPVDPHSMLASSIMSKRLNKTITYEEFLKNKKEPEYAKFRKLAKPISNGFPGGMGYDTVGLQLKNSGAEIFYEVIWECEDENLVNSALFNLKNKEPNLRKKRTGYNKWAIVLDDVVELKRELFNLYPELGKFLQKDHNKFIMKDKSGKEMSKRVKNEWGEWETDQMYHFSTKGVRRKYCTYTSFCNGYLMQTPGAVGAKKAFTKLVMDFEFDNEVNILAFIHDEVVFEVKKDSVNKYNKIAKVANIMISEMQSVLRNVRIAVEADLMDYWKKEGGHWQCTFWKDPGKDILRNDGSLDKVNC